MPEIAPALVLHAYTPGVREPEQRATWEACRVLEAYGYRVEHMPCLGEWGYAKGLRSWWEWPGELVLLEQDLAPTPADVRDLLSCPYGLCAARYSLYPVSTHLGAPVLAHRFWDGEHLRWVLEGEEFAHLAGFGLVRFPSRLRWPGMVPIVPHRELDTRLSRRLSAQSDLLWHLHREVPHHHC